MAEITDAIWDGHADDTEAGTAAERSVLETGGSTAAGHSETIAEGLTTEGLFSAIRGIGRSEIDAFSFKMTEGAFQIDKREIGGCSSLVCIKGSKVLSL